MNNWTENDRGLVIGDQVIPLSHDKVKLILDAHKTALDGERVRVKKLADEWWGMALTAEREKRKALVDAIESYLVKQRVQILKDALAKKEEGK
jgi:hypothetical protein